jgi:hypothetical protein
VQFHLASGFARKRLSAPLGRSSTRADHLRAARLLLGGLMTPCQDGGHGPKMSGGHPEGITRMLMEGPQAEWERGQAPTST